MNIYIFFYLTLPLTMVMKEQAQEVKGHYNLIKVYQETKICIFCTIVGNNYWTRKC